MLVFLFFTFIASAQTVIVKGTVQNVNGNVLPGASVQVQGTKTGTIADSSGNYSLSVTPGRHTLVISFAGYTTERTEITVP